MLAIVPSATASAPNCEVGTGAQGIGVGCTGGSKPLQFCALILYDTGHVNWGPAAGEYGCV